MHSFSENELVLVQLEFTQYGNPSAARHSELHALRYAQGHDIPPASRLRRRTDVTEATNTPHLAQLDAVLATLTVGLIMIPRSQWMTCRPSSLASSVAALNRETMFSTLPVLDENEQRVLGLYDASQWFNGTAPDAPIGDAFQLLSEDMLVAEDASIFDFLRQADNYATNLVVRSTQIAGLVSLSDIEQLPVRTALFTLINSFEMAMASLIESRIPRPDDWKALLAEGRRKLLDERIAAAKRNDTYTGDLLLTQFCDKHAVMAKAKLLAVPRNELDDRIGKIERLRNDIAHANSFGNSPQKAQKVCAVVRDIYDLKQRILAPSKPYFAP